MQNESLNPLSDRFPQLFAGMLALSLALVGGALIGSTAIRSLNRGNDVLKVYGSAKKPIRADYVIWKTSVSSQQPTLQKAYKEVTDYSERVQTYLKEQQIPAEAITFSAIETYAVPETTSNGAQTGRNLAYKLTQRIEIRSKDVDRIAKLSSQATELINEGISLESLPPEYLYTDLSTLRVEMIAAATKDAKSRAEAIAETTGSRVGAVRSAETGIFQITSRHSTEVSDSGVYNTSSVDKDITAVVSLSFSLD
jgi:uncharacterized protein